MRRFVPLWLFLVLVPLSVHAQPSVINTSLCGGMLQSGQIEAGCVLEVVLNIIRIVFSLSGAICVLMLMIGGYQYTLGNLVGGKDNAINTIRNAILGLVASVLSFVIVTFVLNAVSS